MSIDNNQGINLNRQLLIYIPTYNCADYILGVIDEIPEKLWEIADILIVDNCSTDETVKLIQDARSANRWSNGVHLVRTDINIGYSGSQKLAYRIALDSSRMQHVIMLHGDGQYPPELLNMFLPYIGSEYGVVYGFRDKSSYPQKEETPPFTYWIIKLLSLIESLVTGHKRKEWHTGFVMYSRGFLSKVHLRALTDTYHIDGHIQFVAGELDERVQAVPIWKRYKKYQQLGGLNRLTYIFHVLILMIKFRVLGSGQTDVESSSLMYEYSYFPHPNDSTDEIS